MAYLTTEVQLDEVKKRLSIMDEYHDDVLNALIDDTKAYMRSAGISSAIIDSDKAIGCLARGVADQWNMGAADGKFSEIFRERVIQLAVESVGSESDSGNDSEDEPNNDNKILIQRVKTIAIDSNGQVVIEPSNGYDVMSAVVANVNVPIENTKTVSVDSNGQFTVSPSDGYDAMATIEVDVNVPIEDTKTVSVNSNGQFTVSPSDGYDAMATVEVNVNVPPSGYSLSDLAVTAQAIIDKGQTPTSNSPADLAAAIERLTVIPVETPLEFDYNVGYVQNGVWVYEYPTLTYMDIYEIINGHKYLLMLSGETGTRFKVMTTTEDIRAYNSGRLQGTKVVDQNEPIDPYSSVTFTANIDGYLIVSKDNTGVDGLKTYLIDKSA